MSNTVAVRYRSYLPGSGFDSNGLPKQGKQEVRGVISVTSYKSGESLPASKLGLANLDYIDLQVTQAVGGASGQPRIALYEYSSQEFYCFENNKDTNLVGDTLSIRFNAFGDSVFGSEFL